MERTKTKIEDSLKSIDKRGIVLLELIVVVVIVSILYTLSIAIFPSRVDYGEADTFNIKKLLLSKSNNQKSELKLICFQYENICYIEKDGIIIEDDYKPPFKLEFHRYWGDGDNRDEDFEELEKKYQLAIKFIYEIHKNGSSTTGVLEFDEKYVTYFSYFDDFSMFEDLHKASDHLQKVELKRSL